MSASSGFDPAALARYTGYYAARNVWLPNASQLTEGSVTISSSLYPDVLLKGTEFYSDHGGRRQCGGPMKPPAQHHRIAQMGHQLLLSAKRSLSFTASGRTPP